jgi:hypothetical protein
MKFLCDVHISIKLAKHLNNKVKTGFVKHSKKKASFFAHNPAYFN